MLQRLADEMQHLTFGSLPSRGAPGWSKEAAGRQQLARRLRVDSDYLRYLEPSYEQAPALRARAEENAGPIARRLGRAAHAVGPWAVHGLKRTLEYAERSLDPPEHVTRFLQDFEPDVVVVTHLARDSVQADYVRAANRLGLHSAYPVFSWDNLTNKGLVHEIPEVVLVWNESQAREAEELQRHPAGTSPRARRLVVRPLVRLAAVQFPRRVLRARRPARRPADRALRLLVRLRCSRRGRVRPPLAGRAARSRGRGGRDRSAAPAQRGAVGGRRAGRPAGSRLAEARRGAARERVAQQLLRLDPPLVRCGRDQHLRADRERRRRPAGAHRARRGVRARPSRGHCTSTI